MQNKKEWIPVFLQSIAFVGLVLFFLSQYYPYVGMDYKYFIPRLIDSDLHYRINGLSIQWYTPSFGGGLPSYPNPQQIQFSLPQLLTLFIDPWVASITSIGIFILVGMAGTFTLARKILKLDPWSSALAASFFVVNGFYLQHMGIGHLTFMAFPLLPFVIIGLLRKEGAYFNGILLAIVFATLLYGGGFYPIVYFVFSTLLTLPLIYSFFPMLLDIGSLVKNIGWGLLFTAMLIASKLSAVLFFLRNFPRVLSDEFNTTLLQSLKSILFQLLGSMTFAPLGFLAGKTPKYTWELLMSTTGSTLASWELDISVSPVLILFLLAGVMLFVWMVFTKKIKLTAIQIISLAVLVIFVELTFEFITTKGWFYATLSQLPILRSLHVNPRYTAVLILPLAIGGGLSANAIFNHFIISERAKLFTWIVSTLLIFVFVSVYIALPMDTLQKRQFFVDGSLEIYQKVVLGETYPILNIQDDLNDARVFDQNSSTLSPYEVLFGYGMNEFKPTLEVGSVYTIADNTYNLNDPTGFVFGEANGAKPFDRIKTTDVENLDLFVQRMQPNWKLPLIQHFANFLSVFAVVLIFFSYLAGFIYRRK